MNSSIGASIAAIFAVGVGCSNTVAEDKASGSATGTHGASDTGMESDHGGGADGTTDEDSSGEDTGSTNPDTVPPGESDTGEAPSETSTEDRDGDGVTYAEGDCDDLDDRVGPDVVESCDGIDNDCDGSIDEADAVDATVWYADSDGDGFGDAATALRSCSPPAGYLVDATDCDDDNAESHPGAAEECDGVDNDCDGTVDGGRPIDATVWYADADGDGFGDPERASTSCEVPMGSVAEAGDCNDADADTHPGAEETCDGLDNDCDGAVDGPDAWEAVAFFIDGDGDGYGDYSSSVTACEAPDGFVRDGGDCDDTDVARHPSADERCDAIDNDCDGFIDEGLPVDSLVWYVDADGDGYGEVSETRNSCEMPDGFVADATDCNDSDADVSPGADERCDTIDNDCDGQTDEDSAVDASTWYLDMDMDGYGLDRMSLAGCDPGGLYSDRGGDCDDSDSTIYPGAEELCDGEDSDCDGVEESGIATWYAADGGRTDVTTEMSGEAGDPGVVHLVGSGTLRVCPATWYVNLNFGGDDVTVEGVGGVGDVTLSGDMTGGASSLVYNSRPITASASVEQLTVRNLTLEEGQSSFNGGALSAIEADVTLESVRIWDSFTSGDGGGVFVDGGSLTMINVVVTGNDAIGAGGGVFVEGSLDVWNSNYTDNHADNGGGVAVVGDAQFEGGVLTDNTAGEDGGGVWVQDGDLAAMDMTVEGNSAGDDGGGLYVRYGDLDLRTSAIHSNSAVDDGGGVRVYQGDAWMDRLEVSNNTASSRGGGISVLKTGSVSVHIQDSSVEDNTSQEGGGGASIESDDGTATVSCSASASSGGGFFSNDADDLFGSGGMRIDAPNASLTSRGCDWGVGAADNTPRDIMIGYWGADGLPDAYPIFSCTNDGCSGDVDAVSLAF